MPTAIGYFFNPFAVSGDTSAIPVDTQPSGSISYEQGYGNKYSLNLLTDPTAIPIGRLTMNQVLFEITTQLQYLSQHGTPAFITSAQNEGSPFAYPIYARVYYTGAVYENQVAGNTATPGTDDTWLRLSGDATGVLPGTVIDYAGFTVPSGYLACDGTAVSRTTYALLMGVISQTQNGTTTSASAVVTGLSSTAQMWAGITIESANFAPGTKILSVDSSTQVTMDSNASASSTVSIQFFNWGNGDGSTTFNTPDLRRYTTIGQGGTAYAGTTVGQVSGTRVGQTGGQEAHTQVIAELATHDHYLNNTPLGAGFGLVGSSGTTASASLTSQTGSSTPFNVMQPSAIVYKCIKF